MKFSGVLSASLLAVARAAPANVHEKRQALGPKWIKGNALDSKDTIPVRVALKQQNLDKGMDYLLDVSDPSSSNYGQHYTADQVVDIFAPKDESISAVKSWLVASGIPSGDITSSKSKGWLDFTTTVGQLESMLQTKYHVHNHVNGNDKQITAEKYSLPSDISGHVDFVTPAMTFSPKRTPRPADESAASVAPHPVKKAPVPAQMVDKLSANLADTQYCSSYVTPQCIKAFYNIPDGNLSSSDNKLGIFEDDGEFYSQEDLTAFFGLFAPEIPASYGPQIDFIDYGNKKPTSATAEGEAALDFDMAHPILFPQSTVLFQSKDNFGETAATVGFFNQFLDAVDGAYCTTKSHGEKGDSPTVDGVTKNEQCGTFKPTNVVSFSYGWSEAAYPTGYLERQCAEFMKLGLQGVTLVMSSGDGGVAGGHGGDCLGNATDIFNPQNAAACPYITAVGSTVLPTGSNVGDPEKATDRFASGGGFSNVFPIPSYQQSAVEAYFSSYDPGFPFYSTSEGKIPDSGNGIYNRAGRGYPDIAAIGDNGVVVFDGQVTLIGGTSMSAPIMASIFTRINEERLAAGKSTIGFANPALYAHPAMFTDITIGDQSSNGFCLGKGFSCVPGWDPVTGLGTPKYKAMLKYFLSL